MYNEIKERTADFLDKAVSIIILLVAIRLVIYMATSLISAFLRIASGDIWLREHQTDMLHWIVYFIVMAKAYKVLISYSRNYHVNIRYVTELVIIASFIELIFNRDKMDVWQAALLSGFGLVSLIVYLYFYSTIKGLKDKPE